MQLQRTKYLLVLLFVWSHCNEAWGLYQSNIFNEYNHLMHIENDDNSGDYSFSYDEVGNRLSMTSQGLANLSAPKITDTGLFHLDNSSLALEVNTFDEKYGNLEYEFAIGSSAGATDVADWKTYPVNENGQATIDGLDLDYNRDYYVSVRVRNFSGDLVTDTESTDGITVLDPLADPDNDGFNNQSEVDVLSNPLNENSYPGQTIVTIRPGLNLLAIPAEVKYQSSLYSWLLFFGDGSEIEELFYLEQPAGFYHSLKPGTIPDFDPVLTGAEGLIVYSLVEKDLPFETILCHDPELHQGFNLIGVPCPPAAYTAFDLLRDYGVSAVTSIQRYNASTGVFETAAYEADGTVIGVNFPILPGEGYILLVK
jgi:hypothetical protein